MNRTIRAGLWAALVAVLVCCAADGVRADACLGGGGPQYNSKDGSAKDLAVENARTDKQQLGFGFLAAGSVGAVWLGLRRRDRREK